MHEIMKAPQVVMRIRSHQKWEMIDRAMWDVQWWFGCWWLAKEALQVQNKSAVLRGVVVFTIYKL